MKQEVYHQIWRPAPSDAYCLAQNYAVGMLELCGGYSQCENQLRRVLSRDVPRQEPRRALLPLLRQITFELQENLRCIRKASGFSTVRRPGAADFAGLEAPMRLSQYRCRLVQEGLELAPFAALAQNPPRMEPWYLERAGVLFTPPALAQYATVDNLIAATAALRCLLWAQFGPQSDGIIRGRTSKGPGEGYYTAESIFAVTPPVWEPEEQYGEITLVKKHRAPCRPWPFDRGSDAAELPEE